MSAYESEPEAPAIEEDHDRAVESATVGISAWGISIIVHVVALLLLVLVVFIERIETERPPIRLTTFDVPEPIEEPPVERDLLPQEQPEISDEVVVEELVITDLEMEVTEISTESEEEVQATEKGREDAVDSVETGQTGAFMSIGVGGGSAGAFGRGPGARKSAAARGDTTRQSMRVVDAALNWFALHQSPNGQWDVDGYGINCALDGVRCEPGQAHTGADGDIACTAYALLCFLGDGLDHRTPSRHRKVVRAGIDWLLQAQRADGSLGAGNYEHAIGSMALIEAYAMTNDRQLKEPAQRAVDVILARQSQSADGYPLGWDYTAPKLERQDSSITGWNVMALKSAKVAALDVGRGLEGASRWLEGAWKAANPDWTTLGPYDESRFPYTWNPVSGATEHDSRVPMGAVCAVFLGQRPGGQLPMLETMGNYIMAHQLPGAWPTNTYYLYYNSLAIYQLGDQQQWTTFNQRMLPMLIDAQRSDGCFDGSWDWAGTGFHGHETGRLLSTAYCCLSLQVSYRKTRLVDRR